VFFVLSENKGYWRSIMETRRHLQRTPLARLIFIDQSRINLNPGDTHGLAPAGQPAIVIGPQPKHWEPRIDFMGACSGKKQLAFETKTPKQRKAEGVKGWRKASVLSFIRDKLAPAVRREGLKGVKVVVDKALRIKAAEVRAAMTAGGAEDVAPAVVLPTATAKFVSPLDNTLWHQLKSAVRRRETTTEEGIVRAIREEWNAISSDQLHNYYKHCALTRGDDLYKGKR